MAPKKKGEEEKTLQPEECLPANFSIGCEVYWVDPSLPADENGPAVSTGQRGTLDKVHELAVGNRIEFVDVIFEGHDEPRKVMFSGISREPPQLEQLYELKTGLRLPLRGLDVARIWELATGPSAESAQAEVLDKLLGLEAEFPDPMQRDVVRDFHVYSLEHSRSMCFTTGQAAVFHAIMASILVSMRSPEAVAGALGPNACNDCFEQFKNLLLAHATHDADVGLPIFSASEAQLLVDFASGTLFKHFLLYQCCILSGHEVEQRHVVDTLERPLPPPALGQAKQRRRGEGSKGDCFAAVGVDTAELAPAGDEAADAEGGTKEKNRRQSQRCSGGLPDQEDSEEVKRPLTEDEEIEHIVRERLRSTAEQLQKRIEEREEAFRKKCEAAGRKLKS